MKVANIYFFLITFFGAILLCGGAHAQAKIAGINTVVIDAGHGGKDPGCTYKQYREKDIALNVALLFGGMIESNMPDVKVVYTRKTDRFVELAERGNIANRASADLFISIHVNSTSGPAANGTSTWIMGVDKNNKNLAEVMRENDVVSYEEDYSARYEGYVPGSAESYIMFSLLQYSYSDQSMVLGNMIQKQYGTNVPLKNLGLRQGPFLVLWKTAMPSVLTEIGFLSNEKDRKYLVTASGQKTIARSLFNAFSEYKAKVEGTSSPVQLGEETVAADMKRAETPSVGDQRSGTEAGKGDIRFYVQICSSPRKIASNHSQFSGMKDVREVKENGRYKYMVGGYADYQRALKRQDEVRRKIKDAFLVAYDGNVYVPLMEARARTKQ